MVDPVYAALDFETADYQPDSACAVGLAKVRGGEVVDTLYSLLRPPRSLLQESVLSFVSFHL